MPTIMDPTTDTSPANTPTRTSVWALPREPAQAKHKVIHSYIAVHHKTRFTTRQRQPTPHDTPDRVRNVLAAPTTPALTIPTPTHDTDTPDRVHSVLAAPTQHPH